MFPILPPFSSLITTFVLCICSPFLFCFVHCIFSQGLPSGSGSKDLAYQCRTHKRCRFNPRVRKSPGDGNGNILQYSCLETPMDRGACWAAIHGDAQNQTQFFFQILCISEIIWYLFFSVCIISLSMIPTRSIQYLKGSSVQFRLSVVSNCDTRDCSIPGFMSITSSRSLLKLKSIESVMPSNHLILCHPFFFCLQ